MPANCLIHDEVDFSDPEVLEMYSRRLDAVPPDKRVIRQLSTPTVSGFGISALYERSDGRQWMVRCNGCNWRGPLDYVTHTGGELRYLRCSECGGILDPRNGEWVAVHPGREMHGYHVSRLMLAVPERPDILRAVHHKRETANYAYSFFNMDLGLPYEEGEHRVTREEILKACFTEDYQMALAAEYGVGPYFMGIDQGDTLTVTIGRVDPRRDGGRIRLVYLDRLRDASRGSGAWRMAAELIRRFNVSLCIVDAPPNSANAHDLAKEFPNRVLRAYYRDAQRTEVAEGAGVRRRAEEGNVWPTTRLGLTDASDISLPRTASLDRTANDLRGGRFLLPSPPTHPEVAAFILHCTNNVRRPEKAADGTLVFRWKATGPNDFSHSSNYLRVAAEPGEERARRNYMPPLPIPITSARPGRGNRSDQIDPYWYLKQGARLHPNPRSRRWRSPSKG